MKLLLIILAIMIIAVVLLTLWGSHEMKKKQQGYLQMMPNKMKTPSQNQRPTNVTELPDPVQRYVNYCFGDQAPEVIEWVRLSQEGQFRLKPNPDPEKGWLRLTAEQYVNIKKPNFFWSAKIKMNTLIWFSGWDYYLNNQANMHWKLNSLFKIVNEKGTELDQGALMRYLAEMPWFPWVMLSNQQITWEAQDAQSAMATLKDGAIEVSATFHFNIQGQITQVTADRYQSVDGGYKLVPWTGFFNNYQKLKGIYLPLEGEVIWHLPEGDYSYARLKIVGIDLNPSDFR